MVPIPKEERRATVSVDPQAFGRLQAEVEQLQRQLQEMQGDLKAALAILAQAQGSWKTMVAIGGFSSVVGAGLLKVGQWLSGGPPAH